MDYYYNILNTGNFLGIKSPAHKVLLPESMAVLASRMGAQIERWTPESDAVAEAQPKSAKIGSPAIEDIGNVDKIIEKEAYAEQQRKLHRYGYLTRNSPECQVNATVAKMTSYTRQQLKAMPTGMLVNIILARGDSLGHTFRREGYIAIIMRGNIIPEPEKPITHNAMVQKIKRHAAPKDPDVLPRGHPTREYWATHRKKHDYE